MSDRSVYTMEKAKQAEQHESGRSRDGFAPKADEAGSPMDVDANNESTPSATHYASLQRIDGQGMNPRSILMGIGPRGEKFRHMVHDGSLRLPVSAIEILQGIQQECTRQTKENHKKSFELPTIDGVIRPSMDSSIGSITVTELTAHKSTPPVPMQGETPQGVPPPPAPLAEASKWQTHAVNRVLSFTPSTDAPERIRGGGGEDNVTPFPFSMGAANVPGQPMTASEQTNTQYLPSAVITSQAALLATQPSGWSGEQGENAPKPAVASAPQPSTQATAFTTSEAMYFPAPPQATQQSSSLLQPDPSMSTLAATQTPALSNFAAPMATAPAPAPAAASGTAPAASADPPPVVASAAPPPVVSSSSTTPKAAVVPLPSRPRPQWEQQIPGANDEMPTEAKTAKPSWYSSDKVSEFERSMLPEWFDGSAGHRTPDSYKQARERIIQMSDLIGNRYVTSTLVRRTIPGDAGSLLRLHGFLVTWGFINEDAINDSAPTGPGLREEIGNAGTSKTAVVWNENSREELMEAVVDESKKRRKLDHTMSFVPIDWSIVAKRVGNGASAADCERVFLSLPLEDASKTERSITPDATSNETEESSDEVKMYLSEKTLKDIVSGSRPEVIKAATDAALQATDNLAEAKKAAVFALVASEAAVRAREEEDAVSRLLVELQEQRLQKLENRLALLDDVEGVLEAERVALELERRDLYTARCRHWFGGGT